MKQQTVYNPQKGRLEMIDVSVTAENTTWFQSDRTPCPIFAITDHEGGLLIRESGYSYPVLIYNITRSDIGHCWKKAKGLMHMNE